MTSPMPTINPEAVGDLPATVGVDKGAPSGPEAEARIARLFEMTSDLLATLSLDGRFTLLNPAWEQLLGWSPEELQSQPMQELVHPDDASKTPALMLDGSTHPGCVENFTNRFRHRDGSWRWLLWSARCDGRSEEGRVTKYGISGG